MNKDQDYNLLKGTEHYIADLYRSLKIWREFRKGFTKLSKIKQCITIFGSAQFDETNTYYQLAYETAYELGQNGFSIMTGGGPGIMEAANKGAKDAGAFSIGCSIKLASEQRPNDFLDLNINFDYFFIRKVMLLKYSQGFVLFPGGFGTMDEAFEVANLMKTDKIHDFPVVAMGEPYWKQLRPFIEKTMIRLHTIEERDLSFMKLTDNPNETVELMKAGHVGERL
jgi:uncharacterized protein (TIGR00730 family)